MWGDPPTEDMRQLFGPYLPLLYSKTAVGSLYQNQERKVILSMSDSEVQEFIRTTIRRLFDYFDLESKGMTNAIKEIHKTLDKFDREKKKK